MSSDSEESTSGEDVPLAALGGKHLRPPGINSDESSSEEEEAEFDENAEEEEESSEEENDDDDFIADDDEEEEEEDDDDDEESDSEDDVPLASLKSPAKGKKAAAGKRNEKKPAAKKKTAAKPKKKAAAKTKKKANGSKQVAANSSSSSEPTTASGHMYAKSDKGKLIQSVLCRWWYVVTWPDLAAIPPVPRHYDALDGFPGVYVCTSGDDVGKILDHRDPATCPCFSNFAKKTSEELVEMLVTAIANQKEQLIDAEGEGTATERELDQLERWARKLDTAKADREAGRVLKAAKMVI